MQDLRCPKDASPMRSYERSGITVERCAECGGIFLDRGELERLIDGEGEYLRRRLDPRERDVDDDERHYGDRRRRRGWLGDLLDFG